MHTGTGHIYTSKQMEDMKKALGAGFNTSEYVEMEKPPTPRQMARRPPKVGRNEPCPCGSGKKFKKCHYLGRQEK